MAILPLEPETAIGAGLAVLASKDLLNRLLGPSFDYMGQRARGVVEKCDINLDNVLAAAVRKLGRRIDAPGIVSSRILKGVLDQGAFCEDELTAEYLGGVLASSRSEVARDDRGVSYLKIIESLSTYQLRTHFLIYSALVRASNKRANDRPWIDPIHSTLAFTEASYADAMGYGEFEDHARIVEHVFLGLEAHDLCHYGLPLLKRWPKDGNSNNDHVDLPFRYVHPSVRGMELFLWGNGMGYLNPRSYLDLERDAVPFMEKELDVLLIASGCVGWHDKANGPPNLNETRYASP
jgi:hypothetical protein